MNKTLLALATSVALHSNAFAEAQTFDFKDPKGVNNAVFKLDAPLEAINGTATGISGTVTFDPIQPGATKGRIVVTASSLHVPNPMMKEHLQGAQWLDVAKNPEITFEVKSLANVKRTGDTATADITGALAIKGVTREVTAPVSLTYLKDKLGARTNGQLQGDLLVIRSSFTIKRSDFGINPGAPQDKVSDDIQLTLSIAGSSPR